MEFKKEELEEILGIFQQEGVEIISSMDDKLLILENDSENYDVAIQLFRDAHSLKGSARMLGFNNMQNIMHKIEDIISLVKEGKLKLNSNITDFISKTLEFVLGLINKTVENKEEYIDPNSEEYIQKLEKIIEENKEEYAIPDINSETNPEKKEFLEKLSEIENLIINLIYYVSKTRKDNDFSTISSIEEEINKFKISNENSKSNILFSIKNNCQNVINSIDKFKNSDNKNFSFLDINDNANVLIEEILNYARIEKIPVKDYYEIADKKLNPDEVFEIVPDKTNEKIDDLIQKLPLLEINISLFSEIYDIVTILIYEEKEEEIKQIYFQIKQIVEENKKNETILPHDATMGIKEVLELIKSKDKKLLSDAKVKINLIKQMTSFQNKKDAKREVKRTRQTKLKPKENQKEILNTITNTEIKTLRVDSHKLDNLVDEIGELIVSKIKTNEQLSLAKKINNDLVEWQKNFVKMGYYIKYFDKKYLINRHSNGNEYSKIISYNKQLSSLIEQHNTNITNVIKDVEMLFKQLQESETKLNTTTREIETMVKNMRILPLSTIFQLFPRMVHNIAKEKGKKIELIINGDDIAADKTIIEELKIPLMHIIRNSIDHGIETIEERKQKGKNPTGKIEINATYRDNDIIVDIKDDGRGLDIEKIKKKAIEKKLLTTEELNLVSDDELTNLIFYPGFSTEDFVTELSGRGLGLDIVNNKINAIQGRIDIFSELNKGTIVRIILPATVATKRVFVIEEHNQLWAIETSVIKTIVRVNPDDVFEKDNHNYYIYDGIAIPIYTLSQILGFENAPRKTNKYTILIIETDNFVFGVIVEKLKFDQEIVHKKTPPPLYKIKNILGITTLANGEPCLIINISDVINAINSKKIKSKIIAQNDAYKIKNNQQYKILIVDDSYTTRALQQNILTRNGYNVTCVTNPIHALETVNKAEFDLIISDVQMPEMNGFEFISELRKNAQYEKTPVIVVSSEDVQRYVKEIKETRISKFIKKNTFKQNDLLKTIEEVLSR